MILLKYLKMYFSDNTISILFPFVMKLSFLQKSEIEGGERPATYFHQLPKLIKTHMENLKSILEEVAQPILKHNFTKDTECLFLRHL